MLKKFTLIILISAVTSKSFGQHVQVKKEVARISGENVEGFAVDLNGAVKNVTSSFTKYLKSLGKLKQNGDYVMLTESTLSGKIYGLPIYGLTREKANGTQAWLGIKSNEWSSSDAADVSKQLEKAIYDFGVQFYKEKIQEQIDESTRALQAVEKQQQRFLNQNRDLHTRLEDNKLQKIQLEKSLVNNSVEHETLLKKIDQNKKDQDSIAVVTEQIKKIVEAQKEKQMNVN